MKQDKPDIVLSNGTIIKRTRMENGATYAKPSDRETMTDAEWQEFCEAIKKEIKP